LAKKKAFPLRIDPAVYDAIHRWAEDELRSVNGQIEYLLLRALKAAGREPRRRRPAAAEPPAPGPDRGSV
jgi:hypothetical protein